MRGGSIIHSVRHIVLALMIALLPLRGWVGDAMAGQMLQQQLAAINSEAEDVDSTSASGSFDASVALHGQDCEGHMGDMAASDCVTCPSCQVCHGFVLVMPLPATSLTVHPQTAPAVRGETFASAEAVQGFKPPIS
jgi:hypothetical protein